MKHFQLTLLLILFVSISFSQSTTNSINSLDNDIYASSCRYAEIAHYAPLEISTSKDLPKKILCKVKKYIKKRVGKKLTKNFHLNGGRIIDLDELRKVNTNWDNSKTSYELCFSYINLEAGINAYALLIKLDKNGNILEDIMFPKVNKKTIFKNIISYGNMKKIAKKTKGAYITKTNIKKGEYVKYKTEIKMNYDIDNNILIWEFFNKMQKTDNTMLYEKFIFDAHSGKFLKLETSKGTWIS